MKKIIISVIAIIIFLANSNPKVYAANTTSDDWVGKAFSAAGGFLKEESKYTTGLFNPMLSFFKSLIKMINRVLLVALAGISTVALSITGIRYILSGGVPQQKENAKRSLRTIFTGMAIGFGAYMIWRIAMSIVTIIISAFSK